MSAIYAQRMRWIAVAVVAACVTVGCGSHAPSASVAACVQEVNRQGGYVVGKPTGGTAGELIVMEGRADTQSGSVAFYCTTDIDGRHATVRFH